MIVEGTYAEFCKFFGTAFFGNLVKEKTRNSEAKRTFTCEGVNGTPPHKVTMAGEIRFCHPPGRSRLDVLREVLKRYRVETATGAVETYRCDIAVLADDFWQAHLAMIAERTGKFLCGQHDREYR